MTFKFASLIGFRDPKTKSAGQIWIILKINQIINTIWLIDKIIDIDFLKIIDMKF